MNQQQIHMLSHKPPVKQPCNHCGWCCAMEICKIGKQALILANKQAAAPCPFLAQTVQDEFKCSIILAEQKAGVDDLAKMLGIGRGCCADAVVSSYCVRCVKHFFCDSKGEAA